MQSATNNLNNLDINKIDEYLESKGIDVANLVKQMVHEGFFELEELI